jgi:hypothetical protein
MHYALTNIKGDQILSVRPVALHLIYRVHNAAQQFKNLLDFSILGTYKVPNRETVSKRASPELTLGSVADSMIRSFSK